MSINAANVTVNGFTLTNPAGMEAVRVNGEQRHDHEQRHPRRRRHRLHRQRDGAGAGGLRPPQQHGGHQRDRHFRQLDRHVRSSGAGSGKSIKAIYVGDSTGTHAVGVTVTGNTINDVVSSGWGAYGILVNHATSSPGTRRPTSRTTRSAT